MELQGKIIAAMPERSGVSARGEWKSQDFVIETHDQYPRKMVFTVFGADRLQRFGIQVGQEVLVAFDIDAHEWNGRWFNDIRAFDVRPATAAMPGYGQPEGAPQSAPMGVTMGMVAPSATPTAAPTTAPVQTPVAKDAPAQNDSSEDLPF